MRINRRDSGSDHPKMVQITFDIESENAPLLIAAHYYLTRADYYEGLNDRMAKGIADFLCQLRYSLTEDGDFIDDILHGFGLELFDKGELNMLRRFLDDPKNRL